MGNPARFKASRLNSGLYRLYRFFFVIGHLPAHYRANSKVSTKPGQDLEADGQIIELRQAENDP